MSATKAYVSPPGPFTSAVRVFLCLCVLTIDAARGVRHVEHAEGIDVIGHRCDQDNGQNDNDQQSLIGQPFELIAA